MNDKKPTLAYIKRQAKNIKKEKRITHTEALESIAKGFGFSNWIHCQRSLNDQPTVETPQVIEQVQIGFTDWLKKHKKRDSPLGDLANRRGFIDTIIGWPSYDNLEAYRSHVRVNNPPMGASAALERAWKSYKAFLRRRKMPRTNTQSINKPVAKNHDSRTIVHVKGVNPLHFAKRTVEKFDIGDKAWISWDGKKAIPVTIVKVDDRHYTFRTERPLKKAGSTHFVFLDEVRSNPELACINYVTL